MKTDISILASRFVDLTKRQPKFDWSADDIGLAKEILIAAGFKVKAVIQGKLSGDCLEQDGSRTGERFLINGTCPFVAMDEESKLYYHATGWLNELVNIVIGNAYYTPDTEEAVKRVKAEIERSVPLEPIQLTVEGDLLVEYPPDGGYLIDHTRDKDKVSCCVGVHEFCRGWMDRHRATASHDAISCRSCGLRILFPKIVQTYGELREHFQSKFKQAQKSGLIASQIT